MSQEADVMSYLAVRRALGLLGIALPLALYAYARPFGYGMQPSISEFYHTQMGDVVVGSLVPMHALSTASLAILPISVGVAPALAAAVAATSAMMPTCTSVSIFTYTIK